MNVDDRVSLSPLIDYQRAGPEHAFLLMSPDIIGG
jgi:hypothetical protein